MGSKTMRNVVIGVLVGIVALWLGTLPLLMWLVPDAPPGHAIATSSQIGDAFGVINALFSGLALAGVIVAILLQREELRLQRKEIEETRAELKRQADAAEKQEAALREQQRIALLQAVINARASLYQGKIADRAAAIGGDTIDRHIHRTRLERGEQSNDELSLRQLLAEAELRLGARPNVSGAPEPPAAASQ